MSSFMLILCEKTKKLVKRFDTFRTIRLSKHVVLEKQSQFFESFGDENK